MRKKYDFAMKQQFFIKLYHSPVRLLSLSKTPLKSYNLNNSLTLFSFEDYFVLHHFLHVNIWNNTVILPNFHTRKLGKITVFFVCMISRKLTYLFIIMC